MNSPPTFIDNRAGNTLSRAINLILGASDISDSETSAPQIQQVRIATAFFTPTGFAQIAEGLGGVPKVRLLLGVDLAANSPTDRKELDETEVSFERRRMAAQLQDQTDGLERERDHLPFNRTSYTALAKLVEVLSAGNLEVRRYERTFLHAKAYIFTPDPGFNGLPEGVIAGSSNLTGAGLVQNLELNLGQFGGEVGTRAIKWFDELWNDAVPYDLTSIFEIALQPRTPEEIFLRVLWRLYGKEIQREEETGDSSVTNLQLTSFQEHGVVRALRLIREIGGVIVADEVGLGKTFIAGEILRRYTDRRQRALLICPAALRDSTWRSFLDKYQLYVECLSYHQLAGDRQLRDRHLRPDANKSHLARSVEEYQLVIVDEAHNYRNPNTPMRAAVLRRLLFGKKRHLLLLTATPVNNSLWDLYHLIRFFIRQDAQLASHGILSIRRQFESAMRVNPSKLDPDLLYPIIDATTVKRTRQFVRKHYSGDTIPDEDGRPQTIVFPKPHAITIRYALEDRLPGFFDQLERALNSDSGEGIRFARYVPGAYRIGSLDPEESARDIVLTGLLRTGLLKRFESSAFAFLKTVTKMVREHEAFLDALYAGFVVTTAFLREISADDIEILDELAGQSEDQISVQEFHAERLEADVRHDLALLRKLAAAAESISATRDPKVQALSDALVSISHQAENEAASFIDEAQKRKVLVYSQYADTVIWIWNFLKDEVSRRPELEPYRGRIAAVRGSGDIDDIERYEAVQGFAPKSMEAPSGQDSDLYDLLITTDVLAEGVNLQQCRHIINFDLPWNPMRLVQRHGRIDRIGSPHTRVFLRTIFPADRLDDLLNLNERILGKLAMAAASIGVVSPIEGAAQGEQVFTEARKEIEKIVKEDASLFERGGTVAAAQTGEEYRQTLRIALAEDSNQIKRMPWKVGSAMVKGNRRGIAFCAVVGADSKYERTYLRFVPATEEWNPTSDDREIVRETATCLRLLECTSDTPTFHPEGIEEWVYDFWEVAKSDIWAHWTLETDPAYLQPPIRRLNHQVAEFIRKHAPHGIPTERIEAALNIVESPWPRREEAMLRGWFNSDALSGPTLAGHLIDGIMQTGLEAPNPPRELPPIAPDDIELYCWMGIESE